MADVLSSTTIGTGPPPDLAGPPVSGATGRRRVSRERLARYTSRRDITVPTVFLVVLVLVCMLGPFVLPLKDPLHGALAGTLTRPFSHGSILGTDGNGRDVLARLIYGGRVSILVGLCAVAIGAAIGVLVGTLSAYRGGWVDAVVMRLLDVFLAFPSLILALAIADILGASIRNTIIAISFFTVPAYARLARAETLRMRTRDYVVASKSMGADTRRIILGHLLPNVIPFVMTIAPLQIGTAMLTEASLSFLGLGVPVPTPSWGNMIKDGVSNLQSDPWLVLIPSAVLFVTIVMLNLVGNAIREVYTSESS
ncbi:MAG: ABC transporter permease [Acidimicrobiaceae bacterium]|nr:ABC transporter permease [Acidimicrobiaceae bacterium]